MKETLGKLYDVDELSSELRPIVVKVLRISEGELIPNIPLVNYGISSLMSLVLLQKINKHFSIQLLLEEISMNDSINSLAQLVLSKLGDFSG